MPVKETLPPAEIVIGAMTIPPDPPVVLPAPDLQLEAIKSPPVVRLAVICNPQVLGLGPERQF